MYGEIYYYNLDGSLKTTTIELFKRKHHRCSHLIRTVRGFEIEERMVPKMIENFVFLECCEEKFFFNKYNAMVNLKERLFNYKHIETLRIKSSSANLISRFNNITQVDDILKEMEDVGPGGWQI